MVPGFKGHGHTHQRLTDETGWSEASCPVRVGASHLGTQRSRRTSRDVDVSVSSGLALFP